MSFKPRPFRNFSAPGSRKAKMPERADWWCEGSSVKYEQEDDTKEGTCKPNSKGLWTYCAEFADGEQVVYTTDCHLTSSRIWAEIYFGKRVKRHGMVDTTGKCWHWAEPFMPNPDAPRYEFTPEFSQRWIEESCPNYSELADEIFNRRDTNE